MFHKKINIMQQIDELSDSQISSDLMREANYSERSEFYFGSFSMLRKFMDCIEETLHDLERCCQEVNGRLEENDTSPEGKEKIQKSGRQFLKTHRGNFQDLIDQIQRKIDMIMFLQQNVSRQHPPFP